VLDGGGGAEGELFFWKFVESHCCGLSCFGSFGDCCVRCRVKVVEVCILELIGLQSRNDGNRAAKNEDIDTFTYNLLCRPFRRELCTKYPFGGRVLALPLD
jgi:hypothetical protein